MEELNKLLYLLKIVENMFSKHSYGHKESVFPGNLFTKIVNEKKMGSLVKKAFRRSF